MGTLKRDIIWSNLNNFHTIEVANRVSDAQLQVSKSSSEITWQFKGIA